MLMNVSYETLSDDEKIALKKAVLFPHRTIKDAWTELLGVSQVDRLYERNDEAYKSLRRKRILDKYGNLEDEAFGILPAKEARQLLRKLHREMKLISKHRKDIEEEKRKLNKFLTTPKIINEEVLERGIDNYLGCDLAELSDITKSDLEDAMKCLRCGIATPAAMISLRAAEDVVRRYYEFKFGEKPPRACLNDILSKLRNHSDVDKTLINYLDHIRSKRNEAQHPEKIFSQEEAEEIFIKVTNAIKEMYNHASV